MKNKIRFIETSLYYNKHINCQSAGRFVIEAPLDQWYKVGALGSMLTGHLEQLGIPDRERKRKCSEELFMLMSSGL